MADESAKGLSAREGIRFALSYARKAQMAGSEVHAQKAAEMVEAARAELAREAERLGKYLRVTFAHQKALNDKVMEGQIAPQAANQKNRKIASRIAELRTEIAVINTAMSAQTAEELGGFVDMPLEKYAAAATKARARGIRAISLKPTRKGFIFWLVCMLVAILGVTFYMRGSPFATPFTINAAVLPDGNFQVMILNKSDRPVALSVPWTPETIKRGYGLAIFVKTQEDGKFTPLQTTGCWLYSGSSQAEIVPIEIGPRFESKLVLDMNKVREIGIRPVAIEARILTRNGWAAASVRKAID